MSACRPPQGIGYMGPQLECCPEIMACELLADYLEMRTHSCNVSTAEIISERVTGSLILFPYLLLYCDGCNVANTC